MMGAINYVESRVSFEGEAASPIAIAVLKVKMGMGASVYMGWG